MPRSLVFDLVGFTVISAIAAYALTAVARAMALRIHLLDVPDGGRKCHRRATPLMGGVAVFATVCLACVAADSLHLEWLEVDPSWNRLYPLLLVSAGVLCAAGLWDDKWSMRTRTKLIWQILAALPWVIAGRAADPIWVLGVPLELGVLSIGFTLLWLVACANVINLIDGLDGLAGTIGVVISITAAILAIMQDLPGAAFLSTVLAASLAGFLVHNWPPAKIFLGDAGSMTIGFLVGVLSLEASTKRATGLILTVPLVLMSVPIFDTTMAILRRKLRGQAIGIGDREHIHHRLQNRGLSKSKALWFLLSLCVVMAVSALLSVRLDREWIGLSVCGTALSLLIAGRVFGYDETQLFLRHLLAVGRFLVERAEVLSADRDASKAQAVARAKSNFLWDRLCQRAQSLSGSFLAVRCLEQGSESEVWSREWSTDDRGESRSYCWQFTYSIDKPHHTRLEFVVQGQHGPPLRGVQLDALLELGEALYESCAAEPATIPISDDTDVAGSGLAKSAPIAESEIRAASLGRRSEPNDQSRKAA